MSMSMAGNILWLIILALALMLGLARCSQASASEVGVASFYCCQHHGRRTASGERFNQNAMTCAHRTARFGTRFKVTRVDTGRSIVCRVNDRGPARWTGRIIDLSIGAAKKLRMTHRGLARVRIEAIR